MVTGGGLVIIGIPSNQFGGQEPGSEDEIKDFCKDKLTNYKHPKIIVFRDELPKSNVGKILRRKLI